MEAPPPVSAAQCVLKWARERPAAAAVAMGETSFTYAELAETVAKVAGRLIAEGARPGVIAGLQCDDPLWTLLLQLANEVAGAAWLPLSVSELTPEDETAQRCHMFLVESPAAGLGAIGKVLRIDQAFVAAVQRQAASAEDIERLAVQRGPDHAYAVARTSGTTGKPKFISKLLGRLGPSISQDDAITKPVLGEYIFLALYKTTIMGVYGNVFRAFLSCNQIAFMGVDDVVTFQPSQQAYAWLLTRDAERLAILCKGRGLYLDLHFVDVVGSAISKRLHEDMAASLSSKIVNVYSSNETGPIASLEGDGCYAVVDGVEARIVDEAGRPLPQGEVGWIEVRSVQHRISYLWDDALNARHVRDRWFLMNDLGSIPAPGRLKVLGRVDDMLNIGGVKIPPGPIEDALKSIDGVRDAVLLPIENARGVTTLYAAIEHLPGADVQALLPEVRAIVAPQSRTYGVCFEVSLPRTETGKVQRSLLQARIAAELADGAHNRPSVGGTP